MKHLTASPPFRSVLHALAPPHRRRTVARPRREGKPSDRLRKRSRWRVGGTSGTGEARRKWDRAKLRDTYGLRVRVASHSVGLLARPEKERAAVGLDHLDSDCLGQDEHGRGARDSPEGAAHLHPPFGRKSAYDPKGLESQREVSHDSEAGLPEHLSGSVQRLDVSRMAAAPQKYPVACRPGSRGREPSAGSNGLPNSALPEEKSVAGVHVEQEEAAGSQNAPSLLLRSPGPRVDDRGERAPQPRTTRRRKEGDSPFPGPPRRGTFRARLYSPPPAAWGLGRVRHTPR
jgi:hypothetical protein